MRQLAERFSQDLKMTNGCLPASLLLRDVLTARGVPCRLRSGYSVVTLSEEGSPPPLYAAAHMWVEVQGGSGGGGGAGSGAASLDIGLALAQTADAKVASYQLATELPAGAKRIDESEGAGGRTSRRACFVCSAVHVQACRCLHRLTCFPPPDLPAGMMEAVMAALADRADAGAYWAGAPPALQQFRAAMLQRFAA